MEIEKDITTQKEPLNLSVVCNIFYLSFIKKKMLIINHHFIIKENSSVSCSGKVLIYFICPECA